MQNKMDFKAYASAIISLGNELTITPEILKEKIQIELQRKDIGMYREFKDKAFSEPEELYFKNKQKDLKDMLIKENKFKKKYK